jgi:gluconolactonase
MRTVLVIALVVSFAASPPASAQRGQPQGGTAGSLREVAVAAIPGVIAAGATWTRAWQGTDNADGLVGLADGSVLFAQEQPNRVSRLEPNDRVSVYAEQTRGAGSLAVDARGRLWAVQRTCTDPGLQTRCDTPTAIAIIHPDADRKVFAESVDGRPLGRVNDLVISRRGDVYFTSGGAFRMDPYGTVTPIGANLRTNGVMLSPDEKTLYITNGGSVVALDVQPDGRVVNQRNFATLEAGGNGDGLAIDAAGRLYVTSMASGVQVFAPDGTYLGVIPTPRSVISVTFAGADKRTLYVVGSGALDANGQEVATPPGVRNNAKTIFRIPLLAQGLVTRAK